MSLCKPRHARVAFESTDVTSNKRNIHPTLRVNIASVRVLFYLFISFTTGTAHNTRRTPDPGAGKRKRRKKNLAWKSYKKKTSARCRATGGGPSRRTGAVALQAAGVKYLCVTDVFIAFSAPQPAGRGFGSSPRLIKSLHATHPFQPHPLSISIQRKQIRGGGWHLDIFGLRPASLIGPCNCRAVLFCVMLFFLWDFNFFKEGDLGRALLLLVKKKKNLFGLLGQQNSWGFFCMCVFF